MTRPTTHSIAAVLSLCLCAAAPCAHARATRAHHATRPHHAAATPTHHAAPARSADAGAPIDAARVSDAAATRATGETPDDAAILRCEILLDRAWFSPGEIDGHWGQNLETALRGFQASRGIAVTGRLDDATWNALDADTAPVLADYTVTDADVAGPFHPVPSDMMAKAKLHELSYSSPAEALGEKFHASPSLLARLNPGRSLSRSGETLTVPNVETTPLAPVAKIVVDKSDSTVAAADEQGKIVAQFPATMGSQHDPLPIGQWKVTEVQSNPKFHYNPALFWDARPGQGKATIAPGPNNPVGVVWIDLSKEHYGIHGTPDPSKIGKTESHGCVRLTNWSAKSLSNAVHPGTPVVMQE